MGENSKIEWTDHTFNPWIGCTKVAAGCTHCYAEALAKRTGLATWGPAGTRTKTSEAYWRQPAKWNRDAAKAGRRARVFCASLADVFEDWDGPVLDHRGDEVFAPTGNITRIRPATLDDVRHALFALIDATPDLDWLLLTKRPENVRRLWPALAGGCGGSPCCTYRANVWLGTSVATQEDADANWPHLLACRDLAPVLFLSAEPLLGPMDLTRYAELGTRNDGENAPHSALRTPRFPIDWLIAGGESGPGARPMHPDWARSIRDQCQAGGVPFFFKQGSATSDWPEFKNFASFPTDLQIREFPKVRTVTTLAGYFIIVGVEVIRSPIQQNAWQTQRRARNDTLRGGAPAKK